MMSSETIFKNYDYLAPDNSEIRLLSELKGGGLCHCTLPPGQTSKAVKHKTVEEIWYFLEGEGEVWRKSEHEDCVIKVLPGLSLTIPIGVHFQFRNTGDIPLKLLIATIPPWPSAEEAVEIKGKWEKVIV